MSLVDGVECALDVTLRFREGEPPTIVSWGGEVHVAEWNSPCSGYFTDDAGEYAGRFFVLKDGEVYVAL